MLRTWPGAPPFCRARPVRAPPDSQCFAHAQARSRLAVRALCAHHRIASASHMARRGAARLCGALARRASIYLPVGRARGAPCKTASRAANAETIAPPLAAGSAQPPESQRARPLPGAEPFCRARPVRAPQDSQCSAHGQGRSSAPLRSTCQARKHLPAIGARTRRALQNGFARSKCRSDCPAFGRRAGPAPRKPMARPWPGAPPFCRARPVRAPPDSQCFAHYQVRSRRSIGGSRGRSPSQPSSSL